MADYEANNWNELIDFADNGLFDSIVRHTCKDCPEDIECNQDDGKPECPGNLINLEVIEQVAEAGLNHMKEMVRGWVNTEGA